MTPLRGDHKMKVIYSEIKKLVPGLKAKPRDIGQALTMAGFMMDGLEEITYLGKKDYVLSFEVRQNRADCFSFIGLAREIAAAHGLKLKLQKAKPFHPGQKRLSIGVDAEAGDIKRILALEFGGVKNGLSPAWLQAFLSAYGMNSKSLLVDISNYAMILTGYPSHMLDLDKVKGKISWSRHAGKQKLTTLDGSVVELPRGTELVIRDEQRTLALAGIVGGKTAEISSATTRVFAEMAVYNGAVVRKDARAAKVATEAGTRLEKDLDPEGARYAFDLLVSLILEYGKGKITSRFFEYYPFRPRQKKILFDPSSPADFAGVPIPTQRAVKILKDLEFGIKPAQRGGLVSVVVPTFRTDVDYPEDLIEEVTRIFGFGNIPVGEHPALSMADDITPRRIGIIEEIRRVLTGAGFDEILSIPLGEAGHGKTTNYREWEPIVTENAVNENYPELRQSLAAGLIRQALEYQKKNLEFINIFETGKVFGRAGDKFMENESIGMLACGGAGLSGLRERMEGVLLSLGYGGINYAKPAVVPAAAHPQSCWAVTVCGADCGIIYKLRSDVLGVSAYFAELDVDTLEMLKAGAVSPVVELADKLVVLDMNVEPEREKNIRDYVAAIKKKIGAKHLWSVAVVDEFTGGGAAKYTIRVTYAGLDDQAAKKLHAEILNGFQTKK